MVGFIWLLLTVAFEILFGRIVMGLSWEVLLAGYNLAEGGLMPLGLLVLFFSPVIAAKLRGKRQRIGFATFYEGHGQTSVRQINQHDSVRRKANSVRNR